MAKIHNGKLLPDRLAEESLKSRIAEYHKAMSEAEEEKKKTKMLKEKISSTEEVILELRQIKKPTPGTDFLAYRSEMQNYENARLDLECAVETLNHLRTEYNAQDRRTTSVWVDAQAVRRQCWIDVIRLIADKVGSLPFLHIALSASMAQISFQELADLIFPTIGEDNPELSSLIEQYGLPS